MKSFKDIRIVIRFMFLLMVAGVGACSSRKLSAHKSVNSKVLNEEVTLVQKDEESYHGRREIRIKDSLNNQYSFRIYPLDTFTFSLEKGFRGRASSIELRGTQQQATLTVDKGSVDAVGRKIRHAGLVRKVEDEQSASSKIVARSRPQWWFFTGAMAAGLVFTWIFYKFRRVLTRVLFPL